jgi:hypothetical protein
LVVEYSIPASAIQKPATTETYDFDSVAYALANVEDAAAVETSVEGAYDYIHTHPELKPSCAADGEGYFNNGWVLFDDGTMAGNLPYGKHSTGV